VTGGRVQGSAAAQQRIELVEPLDEEGIKEKNIREGMELSGKKDRSNASKDSVVS